MSFFRSLDIVAKNGDVIHIDKLSQKLGCEVVEISALKGTGITKAAEKAVALAQQKKKVTPAHAFSSEVEDIIAKVEDKISSIFVPSTILMIASGLSATR